MAIFPLKIDFTILLSVTRGLVVYPGANVRPYFSVEEINISKIKDDDVSFMVIMLKLSCIVELILFLCQTPDDTTEYLYEKMFGYTALNSW